MQLVYLSSTGNTKRFGERALKEIDEVHSLVSLREYSEKPFILLTPTYGFGETPKLVHKFLLKHSDKCLAVVSFGNTNWGNNFGRAGKNIKSEFGIPWLMRVELDGTDNDILLLSDKIKKFTQSEKNIRR